MTFGLRRHAAPGAWLADCGADLEAEEAFNSLILGAARSGYGPDPPPYLAAVRDGSGRLVLAALMIAPARLVLAPRDAHDDALELLCRDLVRSGTPLGSLNAPDPLAERFAARWSDAAGVTWRAAMRQRLHSLSAVDPVPMPPGALREAGADDLERVAAWIAAFERDAMGHADDAAARAQAQRRIGAREMVLWDDGRPRAMAARARRTRHTETINHVYTPPEERGRGFGTALTAALSRRLLEDGSRECVLFTDLANPTSNAIYARIGYRPIGDFTMVRFGEP